MSTGLAVSVGCTLPIIRRTAWPTRGLKARMSGGALARFWTMGRMRPYSLRASGLIGPPKAAGWLVLAIVTAGCVVGFAYLLLWYGPDLIARHDIGSVSGPVRLLRLQQARDAARGRLLTLGAGLFALGALIFTARNFGLAREGQMTDRYTKAIEQLGSDKLDVRIGGIYALERVASDSAKDQPTVVAVLAAFIREHSHETWPLSPDNEAAAENAEQMTRPDVQAAITVIGRRDPRHDRERINLHGANLPFADLTGANLAFANLAGANLTGARLFPANLASGSIDASNAAQARAVLIHANSTPVDLTGANLNDAKLTGAIVMFADLTGARLFGANLTNADLSLTVLTSAEFDGADLTGLIVNGADFTWSQFEGWVMDPKSLVLRRASADTDDAGN